MPGKCIYCGDPQGHEGYCPALKSIEFDEFGRTRRVEFKSYDEQVGITPNAVFNHGLYNKAEGMKGTPITASQQPKHNTMQYTVVSPDYVAWAGGAINVRNGKSVPPLSTNVRGDPDGKLDAENYWRCDETIGAVGASAATAKASVRAFEALDQRLVTEWLRTLAFSFNQGDYTLTAPRYVANNIVQAIWRFVKRD